MSATSRLSLPLLAAAQAQKHVTHNEALVALDALIQLSALERRPDPPALPAEGARYVVAASPSGAFAGHADALAVLQDGVWQFFAPQEGWICWLADEAAAIVFHGGGWSDLKPRAADRLGIAASADATNRLAVASPAVLFSHAGAGLQVKLNKAAPADTASVLFQTGWSGRAEIGTAGDDKLHVKVSPDGAAWTEALVVDPATGRIGVNTAQPANVLQVNAGSAGPGLSIVGDGFSSGVTAYAYGGFFAGLNGRRARGSLASPQPVLAGDILMRVGAGGYGATAFWGGNSATFQMTATENWSDTNRGAQLELATVANGAGQSLLPRLVVAAAGHTLPGADNAYSCGDGTTRWSAVWSATGTIQTSDARDKTVVGALAFSGSLVDAVDPVLFRWKVGGYETAPAAEAEAGPARMARPGMRAHAGFLAQDLRAAMDASGVDFGAWGLEDKADPRSRQWTRPDQLVAVLWAALKETRAEMARFREGLSVAGG